MNQNRVPEGAPTGGQFAASARAEASVDLGVDADIDRASADHRRTEAFETLDEFTTTDENGRRWAETYEDYQVAEKARLEAQTPKPFDDLVPHDRFVVERADGFVECRVLDEPSDTKDRFGRPMRAFMVRDQSSGREGLYMFGPGSVARTVELPITLRSEPFTEQQLNEGWGV